MISIGITGGIGSGKSTISNLFKLLAIPVYIADIESKRLTESSPQIKAKLIAAFGADLYQGGKLNKALLASYIFNDAHKLAIANSIIHPEVDRDVEQWLHHQQHHALVAIESAILYESTMDRYTDRVLVVYTPVEQRIQRVIDRDCTTREKVIERMNMQLSDEEKMKRAQDIIYNDETQSLIDQTLKIVTRYAR
ncbi:MAG: hypothetical protein RL662_2497 [Bacteroidota bacterium]|jgi:dephospho-CoA kinase